MRSPAPLGYLAAPNHAPPQPRKSRSIGRSQGGAWAAGGPLNASQLRLWRGGDNSLTRPLPTRVSGLPATCPQVLPARRVPAAGCLPIAGMALQKARNRPARANEPSAHHFCTIAFPRAGGTPIPPSTLGATLMATWQRSPVSPRAALPCDHWRRPRSQSPWTQPNRGAQPNLAPPVAWQWSQSAQLNGSRGASASAAAITWSV